MTYEITAILRKTKTFTEIVKEVTPYLIETVLSKNDYCLEKCFMGLRRFDCFAKWYDTVSLNESFMFGPIVFDKKDKYLIAMGKKRPSMDEISEFFNYAHYYSAPIRKKKPATFKSVTFS